MAYLLELDKRIPITNNPNPRISPTQMQKLLTLICLWLKQRGLPYYVDKTKGAQTELHFGIPVQGNNENLHRWTFDFLQGSLNQTILFAPSKLKPYSLPTKVLSYLMRISKTINLFGFYKMASMSLHPRNGQIKIKVFIEYLFEHTVSTLFSLFKEKIDSSTMFSNSFYAIILYYCNRIPISHSKNTPKSFQTVFVDQDLKRVAEVRELIYLRKFPIEGNTEESDNLQMEQFQFLERVRESHQQVQYNTLKSVNLWVRPVFQGKIVHHSMSKGLKKITQGESPTSFMFNTITLLAEQKKTEEMICKGEIIKLTALKIKFSYSQSKNLQEQQHEKQFPLQHPKEEPTLTKEMIVKMPLIDFHVRALEKLKWEKSILSNLRGARQNAYFLKYYHTVQQHFKVKDGLIMDYFNGESLKTMHESRICSSLYTFLSMASKIGEALRFLNKYDIAHLDLSLQNILVDRNSHNIKIIDFGQAFHPQTFLKYQAKIRGYRHRLGKSVPFFAPQITHSPLSFTTQQDIYSLGVIFFYIFFGKFPLFASQKQLQRIHYRGQTSNRFFFLPEIGEDLGPIQLYNSIGAVLLSMLDPNYKRRPSPSWIHLLFNKLSLITIK